MPSITISVSDEEATLLEKRAKKNFLTLKEQIEDIVRRSAISSRKGIRKIKVDDRLVDIFSRQKSGRKRKK